MKSVSRRIDYRSLSAIGVVKTFQIMMHEFIVANGCRPDVIGFPFVWGLECDEEFLQMVKDCWVEIRFTESGVIAVNRLSGILVDAKIIAKFYMQPYHCVAN